MIEVRDNLHSNVCFASTRWTHHHREARLHTAADSLHLSGRERHCVPVEGVECGVCVCDVWRVVLTSWARCRDKVLCLESYKVSLG